MMDNDLYIVFSNITLVITLPYLSAYTFSMRHSNFIFVIRNFRFELLLLHLALPNYLTINKVSKIQVYLFTLDVYLAEGNGFQAA